MRLFTTSGQLLTTFINPIPADNIFYGQAVAAVGTYKVLVGAYQSGFGSGIERVFLFSTNGALVTTLTNPRATGAYCFAQARVAEELLQVVL